MYVATPEEKVRRKVLKYFRWRLLIPSKHIQVEVPMTKFGYINNKERADILITRDYDEDDEILAVIECKATYVKIDDDVIAQVMRYATYLNAEFAFATNGVELRCFRYNKKQNGYVEFNRLETYKNMVKSFENVFGQAMVKTTRSSLDNLHNVKDIRCKYKTKIGQSTSDEVVPIIANLIECLYDIRIKIQEEDFEYFKLINDEGIRRKEFGNPGGIYNSKYRMFQIMDRDGENHEIGMSIDIIYDTKTALNVSVDNHHALHYVLDDKSICINHKTDMYVFTHKGRISYGRGGSGKAEELRELIYNEFPSLISDQSIVLGELSGNVLLDINTPSVVDFIGRIIVYSLIRDKYRKNKREKINRSSFEYEDKQIDSIKNEGYETITAGLIEEQNK